MDTLLEYADASTSKEERRKLVPLLVAHFDDLAVADQRRWLEDKWPVVRSEKWLPTLQSIAAKYADNPIPDAPNVLRAYDYFKLSSDGLVRSYELDPESARSAVLAEIVRPKPSYSANTLGMLPDKILPNEERAIADHFVAAESYAIEVNLASLLNRYTDAAVLAEFAENNEKGRSQLGLYST